MQKALQDAQEALNQMAKEGNLEEMLNAMKEDLENAQKQMCEGDCQGGQCQGQNESDKIGNKDWAKGKGIASGRRDENKDDTRTYKSKTKTEFNKGPVFIVGQADGKSVKGNSRLTLKDEVVDAGKAAEDAISRQKVPNDYKEHTRDYFEKLNKQNTRSK